MVRDSNSLNSDTKSRSPVLVIIIVLVFIIVAANIFSTFKGQRISTDKSSSNSKVEGNKYTNIKYKFSIEFPEGWELGVGGNPSIVQKAVKEFSTISVGVRELGQQINKISDTQSLDEFKNDQYGAIEKTYEDTKLLDFGEKNLSGSEAYWLLTTNPYKVNGENKYHKAFFIATIRKGIYYFISVSAPISEYDKLETIFMDTIDSFILEN